MRVSQADNLADIFIPQLPSGTVFSTTSIWLTVLLFTAVLLLFFWYYKTVYINPWRSLEQQLIKQSISPVKAADQLAELLRALKKDLDKNELNRKEHNKKTEINHFQSELDRLRFKKQPPRPEQILLLLQRIKRYV